VKYGKLKKIIFVWMKKWRQKICLAVGKFGAILYPRFLMKVFSYFEASFTVSKKWLKKKKTLEHFIIIIIYRFYVSRSM
jgi:hypothetical protein